jgi:hypothetical protein
LTLARAAKNSPFALLAFCPSLKFSIFSLIGFCACREFASARASLEGWERIGIGNGNGSSVFCAAQLVPCSSRCALHAVVRAPLTLICLLPFTTTHRESERLLTRFSHRQQALIHRLTSAKRAFPDRRIFQKERKKETIQKRLSAAFVSNFNN